MLRRPLLLLAAAFPLLLAMGGGGTPLSDTIPRPRDNYAAELLDRQGYSTRASHVSCNGQTFLPLERGEGVLLVPFERIVRVRLGGEKGKKVEATVEVRGAKPLEGLLPRGLLCTGVTDYGSYQVEARGLKEIVFGKP
jgi:hypothetical protein